MTSTSIPTTPTGVPSATQGRATGGAWAGWILFAGIMLMLVGSFQLIAGLVAIFQRHYYLVGTNGNVVHLNYTGWGWLHIAVAALNVAAGFGLITGKTWARIWAMAVAGVSAIVNLGFTAAYPVWTIIMVTIDVIIIYALAVHWDDGRALT